MPQQSFIAVVKPQDDAWIGWIEVVAGVHCQQPARDDLPDTLRITLAEALEVNRREARVAAGRGYEALPIAT